VARGAHRAFLVQARRSAVQGNAFITSVDLVRRP
jgi:hypothetical protein